MKFIKLLCLPLIFIAFHSSVQAQTLEESEAYWRNEVVRYCGTAPSKEDCDDGDSIIFNGLLCMSGEESACAAIRSSQDGDGQFWRSPRRTPGNLGEDNSFSRDQALGALLYLVKTRDTDAAQRWINWINDNKTCSLKNPLRPSSCVVFLYRLCRDNSDGRCTITPGMWGVFKRVWDNLGLPTHKEMDKNATFDVSDIEMATVDGEPRGYTLHLKAVASFLRLTLQSSVDRSRTIISKVYAKDRSNPFFQILAEGPNEDVINKVLQFCPKPGQSSDFRRYQWSWERDMDQQPYLNSMGWECVFMANLIHNYASIIP